MRLIDIHNHTIYSDGVHSIEDIIINAIENNLQVVGITDHHKSFFMDEPEYKPFDEYLREIQLMKKRYKKDIEVLAGLEINLNFRKERDVNRIPFDKVNKLDYVLLERTDGVGSFEGINQYNIRFKDINIITEKLKCKVGLAHTDLFRLSSIYKDRGGLDFIIEKMQSNNLFWEINIQRQYEYFDYIINNEKSADVLSLFRKLREAEIEVVTGSDTHLISFDFNRNNLVNAHAIINTFI